MLSPNVMAKHMHPTETELDRALRELKSEAWDLPAGVPELERRSSQATARVQRSRRLRRRFGAFGLAAAIYGLGIVSARAMAPATSPELSVTNQAVATNPVGERGRPPVPELQPRASDALALAPEEFERRARRGSRRRSAARWKQAGDLFLERRGAVADALRCYRKFLASAAPRERARQESDTWLLAQLKTHRP